MKSKQNKLPLIEYYGKLEDEDPLDDILYWQNLSTTDRFIASLNIIKDYCKARNINYAKRLDRSFITVGKMEGPLRDNRGARSNGIHRAKGNKRS